MSSHPHEDHNDDSVYEPIGVFLAYSQQTASNMFYIQQFIYSPFIEIIEHD